MFFIGRHARLEVRLFNCNPDTLASLDLDLSLLALFRFQEFGRMFDVCD